MPNIDQLKAGFSRLNESIATRAVVLVATMECVYAFTILALLPLVFPKLTPQIQFISSGVLQLVLLPLIMVGTNIQGRPAEQQRQKDHEALMALVLELHELHQMEIEAHRAPKGPEG